jgi:hypothetical protein
LNFFKIKESPELKSKKHLLRTCSRCKYICKLAIWGWCIPNGYEKNPTIKVMCTIYTRDNQTLCHQTSHSWLLKLFHQHQDIILPPISFLITCSKALNNSNHKTLKLVIILAKIKTKTRATQIQVHDQNQDLNKST